MAAASACGTTRMASCTTFGRCRAFSSQQSGFRGCQRGLQVTVGYKFTMMKKGIHPPWHPEAKVFCNGVEVMTVGGVKSEYIVDVYSGNHPFYQGVKTTVVMDEGQVNKFKKRFEGLDEMADMSLQVAPQAGKKDDEYSFDKKLITASRKKGKK